MPVLPKVLPLEVPQHHHHPIRLGSMRFKFNRRLLVIPPRSTPVFPSKYEASTFLRLPLTSLTCHSNCRPTIQFITVGHLYPSVPPSLALSMNSHLLLLSDQGLSCCRVLLLPNVTPEPAFFLHSLSPFYLHPTLPSGHSRGAVTVLFQNLQSSLFCVPRYSSNDQCNPSFNVFTTGVLVHPTSTPLSQFGLLCI